MIVVFIVFVVIIGGFYFLLGRTILAGNYWFENKSVVTALQVDYPDVEKVLKSERNVFAYSRVLVENNDGSRNTFCIDSDVLWNYEIYRAGSEGCSNF